MILTLMLLILAATLVIVIIGFVMDRIAVTKIKSGMRTMNKRIKRLEKEIPKPMFCVNDKLYEVELEDGNETDTTTDSETETGRSYSISSPTGDEV